MRALRVALVVALVAPVLAGCTLVKDPEPKDVAGTVSGYDPTASHLKVHLLVGGELVLVDFDRRDWNVAGIADMIDQRQVREMSVHGIPREVLNELLVETVGDPSSLSKLRWTDQTSPEERSAAEQAYDALVAKAHPVATNVPTPSTPIVSLPAVS